MNSEGAHNGRRREGETEKERGRPASKRLDLHEKKHDAILLLTSAAGSAAKKVGVCCSLIISVPQSPKLHVH